MDHKIVEKESFRVVGKGIRVSAKDGENLRRIPEFWNECQQDGSCEKIGALAERKDMLGICMEFDPELEEFTYMIAVESTNNPDDGMVEKSIPAASWAVFPSLGPIPCAIQKVIDRIFTEWLPFSEYEHANAPELEVYPPGDLQDENYYCEVWIPVFKK